MATVGIVPGAGSGPALQDGAYLLGIAGGQNKTYQNALVAKAGGTKAAGIQLAAGVALFGFATVASANDSAVLPAALAGSMICIRNAAANTLGLYAKGNDKINGVASATQYSVTSEVSVIMFCVKDGAWSAVKSA